MSQKKRKKRHPQNKRSSSAPAMESEFSSDSKRKRLNRTSRNLLLTTLILLAAIQLLIQFQTATCMLVIADDAANAYLEPETAFVDLETVFPAYDCVDGYRIRLDQTKFAELLELETPLNEGCYLAIRAVQNNMSGTEEMQAAYDQAMPILEAFLEILTEGAGTDG